MVTPRIYLPLVARGESAPAPGTWITVLEEGFENAPGSLWSFFDYDGTTSGEYYWADRTCHSLTGSRSTSAVGGGSDGAALSCNSDYPDNADSWMKYGPFSLADAQMAELRFNYYLRDLAAGDLVLLGRIGGWRQLPLAVPGHGARCLDFVRPSPRQPI